MRYVPAAFSQTAPIPSLQRSTVQHTQLGRLANGDDIKGPIAFLASDASAYLTGLSIPVDGGYTCI